MSMWTEDSELMTRGSQFLLKWTTQKTSGTTLDMKSLLDDYWCIIEPKLRELLPANVKREGKRIFPESEHPATR